VPRDYTQEKAFSELRAFIKGALRVILHFDPLDMRRNRGFAFIDFENDALAQAAFDQVSRGEVALGGHICSCDWATPDNEPSEEVMSKVKIIFARYLPLDTTEEFIMSHFGQHGEVEKVKKNRDFWFIHFADRNGALAAIQHLDGTKVGSNTIQVMLAKPINPNVRAQQLEVKRQFGYRPYEQPYQPRGGDFGGSRFDSGNRSRPFDRNNDMPRSFNQPHRGGDGEGDRMGGGGGGGGGGMPSTPGFARKYKLCDFYMRGSCHKGPDCRFAHGEHELSQPSVGSSPARPFSSPARPFSDSGPGFSPRGGFGGSYNRDRMGGGDRMGGDRMGGGYGSGRGPNDRYDRGDRQDRFDRGMGDRDYRGDFRDRGDFNRGDRYPSDAGFTLRGGDGGGSGSFRGGYKRNYDDMNTPSKSYDNSGFQGQRQGQQYGGRGGYGGHSSPAPVASVPLPGAMPYQQGQQGGQGHYDASYNYGGYEGYQSGGSGAPQAAASYPGYSQQTQTATPGYQQAGYQAAAYPSTPSAPRTASHQQGNYYQGQPSGQQQQQAGQYYQAEAKPTVRPPSVGGAYGYPPF